MDLHDPVCQLEAQGTFTTRDVAAFRAQRHSMLDELGLFVATLVNPTSGIDWERASQETREAITPWLDALEDAGYLQPYLTVGAADPRLREFSIETPATA